MESGARSPEGPRKSLERELLDRAVHDLKNPLAVVRASLEWLEVELADREEALDAVRDAAVASERLMTIVDDFDALARLGADGLTSGDPVALVPLVAGVVEAARARFARRGLALAATAEGAFDTTGDGRLLGRSLTALVDAAARGAPAGACVEVRIAHVASVSGARMIEIDLGLQGLVDAGDRAAALDVLESTGLGVYVALRVIEAHGGTLEVVPTTTLPRIVVRLPG
jgi:two-component system OmpR family sensor kinase